MNKHNRAICGHVADMLEDVADYIIDNLPGKSDAVFNNTAYLWAIINNFRRIKEKGKE